MASNQSRSTVKPVKSLGFRLRESSASPASKQYRSRSQSLPGHRRPLRPKKRGPPSIASCLTDHPRHSLSLRCRSCQLIKRGRLPQRSAAQRPNSRRVTVACTSLALRRRRLCRIDISLARSSGRQFIILPSILKSATSLRIVTSVLVPTGDPVTSRRCATY